MRKTFLLELQCSSTTTKNKVILLNTGLGSSFLTLENKKDSVFSASVSRTTKNLNCQTVSRHLVEAVLSTAI